MKKLIFFLSLSLFILSGCLERPIEFERLQPNYNFEQFENEVIDEAEKMRIQKLQELATIASTTRPLTFSISNPDDTYSTLNAYQYCWRVPGESCSPNVREPKPLNNDYIQFTYPVNKKINIHLDVSFSYLPEPTKVELFTLTDGVLTPVPLNEEKNFHFNFNTLPTPITYTYILRAEYSNEHIYGLAHYAFKITGK